MRYAYLATALAASLLLESSALGHHSVNHFATDRWVTLQGRVTEYEYRNPHVFILFSAIDERGELQEWEVEGQGISLLRPRGLGPDSINPGDVITVIANPHQDSESRLLNGHLVTLEGGQKIALHSVTPPEIAALTDLDRATEDRATSMSGIWLSRDNAYFQLFQREDWKLTERGAAEQDSFDGTQIPQADCRAAPPPRLTLWPVLHRIEISDDLVTIRSDWMGAERTVQIDGSHPEIAEPTILGHSIGQWEDDTLVVDTTHFAEAAAGITLGIGSSEQKHLVERFSLDEDLNQLLYEFVLEDPEYLEEPLTGSAYLVYRPDQEFTGVECDPEVSSRFLDEL
jgi:hypothetical protein